MRYLRVVGRRLIQAVPSLFGVIVVTFLLLHLLPGDPARSVVGTRATPEVLALVRTRLGITEPLWYQFWLYMKELARGDLGTSFVLNVPVSQLIIARLPATLLLVFYAGVLAVVVGMPLALYTALRHSKLDDVGVRVFLVIGLAVPGFWLGVLLVAWVALKTGWFPSGGYGVGFIGHIHSLFLPALTLALSFLAVFVRNLRASLIEVLAADYIALARLKGISSTQLVVRHVLRNGLGPALTILGLNLSYLLGASVIVESVFAVNGVGNTLISAILARDYLLVQGITVVFGVLVIGITLLVDLGRAALDPRESR